MSFQPPPPPGSNPSPFSPSGPGSGPPRSTPIPGSPSFDSAPPSAADFLGGQAPPPGAGPDLDALPFAAPTGRSGRSFVGVLVAVVLLVGLVGGVGAGIWAVLKASDAVETGENLADPTLSDDDRAALGVEEEVVALFDGNAPAGLAAQLDADIPGEPTRFSQILIYPDYAFATAQDPAAPSHLDEYPWRLGKVGTPTPKQNVDDVESLLFSAADITWSAIPTLVQQAPTLLNVEAGTVSHIIIDRSVFGDGLPLVIRVYVTGPRSSGYVEASRDGTVIATH